MRRVDVDVDGGRGRGEGEIDAEDGEREDVRAREDVDEAEEVERRMGCVGMGLRIGGRGGGSTICGIGGRGILDVDVDVDEEDFVAASERRLDNLLKLNPDPDFLPILPAFRSS